MQFNQFYNNYVKEWDMFPTGYIYDCTVYFTSSHDIGLKMERTQAETSDLGSLFC